MIIWPIQSVTKNEEEIQILKEIAVRQKTKKIIYPTLHKPWINPILLEPIVDRIIKLNCENDNPEEYKRILSVYKEDMHTRNY